MATVSRPGSQGVRPPQGGEMLDRQPPRSLEAERAVLGSILLLPEMLDEVALLLRVEDFYDDAHQRIYRRALEMHDAGGRVDHTLLIERLKGAGEFELVGGAAAIAEIARAVPTAAHAAYYARIVHDKAMARTLIRSSTEILRDAYDETVDPRSLISRAEEKIFAILDEKTTGEVSSIKDVLLSAMARLDARMKHDHVPGGLETGFSGFDDLTGGLHGSEFVVIAGRPSMGKTALAMNIAEHVAIDAGTATLFVSLEMSAIELADRLLCSCAKVNGNRLRNGLISKEDRTKLVYKANEISQAPLFIDDAPSRTMTEIAATARRLKRRNNLGLAVIDYLQLIEPDNPKDPRQEQVARIARRLKGLARELDIPVVCLAQLNRQAETARDNKPRLSHLRESGAIEQDADLVMFVHREEYYRTSEEEKQEVAGQADLIISKQRNGPVGEVKLTWLSDYTRFANAAPTRYNDLPDDSFGD